MGWAQEKFETIDLSDVKLNTRAAKLAQRLAEKPSESIPNKRMRGHAVVLNIQDTTELDFNGCQSEGLDRLCYEAQRGMYLHPTYAVSTTREPLSVVGAWMWACKAKSADGQCADIKESERWIEGYERVAECARQLPEVRQVYVADREAYIMALLRKASELNHAADFVMMALRT